MVNPVLAACLTLAVAMSGSAAQSEGNFQTLPGTADLSPDVKKLSARTPSTCWDACVSNVGCEAADYRALTRTCWLKAGASSPRVVALGIDGLVPVVKLGATDRVAVTADGNFRDEDDIGATPMTLALLAAGGALDRLVYYGYRNHVWSDESATAARRFRGRTQDERMRAAVSEGIAAFDLDPALFVDEKAQFERGVSPVPEFVEAIEASGPGSRLWIVAAGPMYTVYAAVRYADASKLRYVDLVSHSVANNRHAEDHRPSADWETLKRLVIDAGGRVHYGGPCRGEACVPPTFAKPRDQNAGLDFRRAADPLAEWTWLRDSGDPRLEYVYDKIEDSNVGDVSDAGMAYYILTGEDDVDPRMLKEFFRRRFEGSRRVKQD